MANQVVRTLISKITESQHFSIICDEVTDVSSLHHLGVSFRWVDEAFEIHEDFIGLHEMSNGSAQAVTELIKDILCRCGMNIKGCRGQCYDGASVMAGVISGVSQRLLAEEPRAVFVHCLAHSLNLAVQDSARAIPIFRDMFDNLRELITFMKQSLKRLQEFSCVQQAAIGKAR